MNEESSEIRRDLVCSSGLPPKRAFWESLALVAIPSGVLWTAVYYFAGFEAQDWLIFAIFAFIPVPLLVPFVYYRYRRGIISYVPSPRERIVSVVSAIIFLCCSVVFSEKRHNYQDLVLAVMFMILALTNLTISLKKSSAPTGQ